MHWREKNYFSRLIWHASRWNKFLKMKWRKERKREGWKKNGILHTLLHLFEILGTFDDTRSKWVPGKKSSNCFHFSDRVLVNISVINYNKPGTAHPGPSVPHLHELYWEISNSDSIIQTNYYHVHRKWNSKNRSEWIWSDLSCLLLLVFQCKLFMLAENSKLSHRFECATPINFMESWAFKLFFKSHFFCLSWLGL